MPADLGALGTRAVGSNPGAVNVPRRWRVTTNYMRAAQRARSRATALGAGNQAGCPGTKETARIARSEASRLPLNNRERQRPEDAVFELVSVVVLIYKDQRGLPRLPWVTYCLFDGEHYVNL